MNFAAPWRREDDSLVAAGGDIALGDLLRWLDAQGYDFVTPTPATQSIVCKRATPSARDARDVFGWSRSFSPEAMAPELWSAIQRAGVLQSHEAGMRSRVRVSRVHGCLFLHSAYPTNEEAAVFLGPDSYRFADFIEAELGAIGPVRRIVDVGAGAGVGGILAGRLRPEAFVTLADVNVDALALARVNARHAGVQADLVCGCGLSEVQGPVDLILANPPYLVDVGKRVYRDGGDMHGAGLSLGWALEAAYRLDPGGRLLLYTGSAIVDGHDALHSALREHLAPLGCDLRYREIDPDIFGEELRETGYHDVERIAAIGAVVIRRAV